MLGNLTRKELRDYYAAEAMNALVTGHTNRQNHNAQSFARRAFDIADAMLKESDRPVLGTENVSGIGGAHV